MILDKGKRLFSVSQLIISLALILLNLATIIFLIWASNKGLDVTDEGIYLMAARFPEEVKIAPSTFYIYTSYFFKLFGYNLIALRIISILLMVGSSVILFLGIYEQLKSLGLKFFFKAHAAISSWSLLCLGALLHYAWWLLTPGYNLINSLALNCTAGFLLLGLSMVDEKKKYLSNVFFCAAGLCTGISLIVKLSTGMSLLVIISGTLLFWPRTSYLNSMKNIIFAWTGIIVWLSIHFGLIQSPLSWWQILQRGIENALLLNPAYGAVNLKRYILEFTGELMNDFLAFWKFYLSVFLCSSVLLVIRRSHNNWRSLPHVLLILLFAAMSWKSYHLYFSSGVRNISTQNIMIFYLAWILVLVFILIVSLIYFKRNVNWQSTKQARLFWTVIILLIFPFAGVIGTGNSIYTGMFLYLAPWFSLLMILLIIISILFNTKWIFKWGIFIIGILACAQISCGVLMIPYRLNTPLLEQTVPTDIGVPATRLMLDPASSEFFKKIQNSAKSHGFKPGDDVLAFCDIAGVAFAIGGRSPYITHYTSGYQGSHAVNEKTLSWIPKERIKKAFILQNVSGNSWKGRVAKGTDGFPDLSKFGINFPKDYILCGEATGTYYSDLIRLWKPKK